MSEKLATKCDGLTKTGNPCKRYALKNNNGKCKTHTIKDTGHIISETLNMKEVSKEEFFEDEKIKQPGFFKKLWAKLNKD